ncbi:hypothetical protein Btru_018230 [Bulinus truncatus]|nr:hypothetical protein Btru_018230 [Bulinus truncatus]
MSQACFVLDLNESVMTYPRSLKCDHQHARLKLFATDIDSVLQVLGVFPCFHHPAIRALDTAKEQKLFIINGDSTIAQLTGQRYILITVIMTNVRRKSIAVVTICVVHLIKFGICGIFGVVSYSSCSCCPCVPVYGGTDFCPAGHVIIHSYSYTPLQKLTLLVQRQISQ